MLSLLGACATAPDAPQPPGKAPTAEAQPTTNAAAAPADTKGPAEDAGLDAAPAAVPPEPFSVWRQREPIYELYVRHFSTKGDFAGVTAKLPELKALGIGIVWLMPVHEIGSIVAANGGQGIDAPHGNPYAVKSYEKLNAEYGTEQDLKTLVATAHALGMHVIIDWVPNHTAWDNPLMQAHPDWYARHNGKVLPVPEFPWIAQLDWSNLALREYMLGTMEAFTKKFDVDGYRIDFAHAMPLPFFDALRTRLEAIKPVLLLAESGAVGFHPTFDMTYDWDVYPLLGDVAWGHKPVTAIDDALYHKQLLPYAGMPDALVMRMTYNHDDNGKFTLTERYQGGTKTFAVLSSLLPGKPLVFDGQEVGMRVFDGKHVQSSINLGHDPAVKIDWSDPEGYRPFYTKLLQLFRANPALHQAGMSDFRKVDLLPGTPAYAFVRRKGPNNVLVVLNLSGKSLGNVALTPTQNAGSIDGTYVELFSGKTETVTAGQAFPMGPWEYRVYVQGPTH
jgi:glycosidase